jgi:uncharacterized integral membrane protein
MARGASNSIGIFLALCGVSLAVVHRKNDDYTFSVWVPTGSLVIIVEFIIYVVLFNQMASDFPAWYDYPAWPYVAYLAVVIVVQLYYMAVDVARWCQARP